MPSDKRQRQREGRQQAQQQMQAQRKRASRQRTIVLMVVIGLLFAGFLGLSGRGGGKKKGDNPVVSTGKPAVLKPLAAGAKLAGDPPCPNADGSSPRTTSFEKAPPMCIDPSRSYKAVFKTNKGDIQVDLDTKNAPGTVNNFVFLARYGYYDGTAMHRTDPSIAIIQGGSPSTQSASDPGPGYTIKDEGSPPRHYTPGDLVMARTSGPDSAGAQFFFVAGDQASALDTQGTYVTFGKVAQGLDLVKKILALHAAYPPTDPKSQLGGAPREAVIITKLQIVES